MWLFELTAYDGLDQSVSSQKWQGSRSEDIKEN